MKRTVLKRRKSKEPNKLTTKAIKDAEKGRVTNVRSLKDFFKKKSGLGQ